METELTSRINSDHSDSSQGCFICHQTFINRRKELRCSRCGRGVCLFCSSDSICFYCVKESDTRFAFVNTGGITLSQAFICACLNCGQSFCRPCCECEKNFCSNCLIFIRNIWETPTPHVCFNCWPKFKSKIPSSEEGDSEIFQGDLRLGLKSEFSPGSCAWCRKKGVCEKCHVCKTFFCSQCVAFVHVQGDNKQLKLLCRQCLTVSKTSRPLFGCPPGFFSLSLQQQELIDKRGKCYSCQSVFTFFIPPFPCKKCLNDSCKNCWRLEECASCSEGKSKMKKGFIACDHCKEPCSEGDIVWVNDVGFHPRCVAERQRKPAVCAFCNSVALSSQETCVVNNKILHNACLVPFRKIQQNLLK